MISPCKRLLLLTAALLSAAGLLCAEDQPPAPILLGVDATDATRKILHAHLTFAVQPGPLSLFYPKWIPGEHAPTGPINSLVNLHLRAAGNDVPWARDPVDLYVIRCEIPAGAHTLEVTLDYVVPTDMLDGYSSSTSSSAQLAIINWNQVILYPEGFTTDKLTFRASLKLPPNWKFGTALIADKTSADTTDFHPVTLTTLVDSPVVAGAFFRRIPLTDANAKPPAEMDIVADSAAALALPDEDIARFRSLVAEAGVLFAATHYERYHFLVALSDHIFHSGIEHHQSSLNTMPERTLIDKDGREAWAGLLPHEFTHSWNGKYRRPASLATPDFQEPMRDDLLWVYEGLTQYLGSFVLTARAGLVNPEQSRDWLASVAAELDHRSGRSWRNLQDTATAASQLYEAPHEWVDLRRSVDFYPEGVLIWLEADATLRQLTNGQRSMDDFCHAFHGGQSGAPAVVPYSFDDVVNALNAIAPSDWRRFLRTRLDSLAPRAPLGGIESSGWKLIYNDQPNRTDALREQERKTVDLRYSLGLFLKEDGTITEALAGGPCGAAGIAPGMKLVAVNGRAWTPKILKEALSAAKADGSPPVELLVLNADYYRSYSVPCHGGERYPHLERDASKPDLLESICHSHAPPKPAP